MWQRITAATARTIMPHFTPGPRGEKAPTEAGAKVGAAPAPFQNQRAPGRTGPGPGACHRILSPVSELMEMFSGISASRACLRSRKN